MKTQGLLLAMLLAAAIPVAAQGPARVGLSARSVAVSSLQPRATIAVAQSGLTHSERGALIGAIVGVVIGAALSAHYDEKSFSSMATAGVITAIPARLIGAIIGLLR